MRTKRIFTFSAFALLTACQNPCADGEIQECGFFGLGDCECIGCPGDEVLICPPFNGCYCGSLDSGFADEIGGGEDSEEPVCELYDGGSEPYMTPQPVNWGDEPDLDSCGLCEDLAITYAIQNNLPWDDEKDYELLEHKPDWLVWEHHLSIAGKPNSLGGTDISPATKGVDNEGNPIGLTGTSSVYWLGSASELANLGERIHPAPPRAVLKHGLISEIGNPSTFGRGTHDVEPCCQLQLSWPTTDAEILTTRSNNDCQFIVKQFGTHVTPPFPDLFTDLIDPDGAYDEGLDEGHSYSKSWHNTQARFNSKCLGNFGDERYIDALGASLITPLRPNGAMLNITEATVEQIVADAGIQAEWESFLVFWDAFISGLYGLSANVDQPHMLWTGGCAFNHTLRTVLFDSFPLHYESYTDVRCPAGYAGYTPDDSWVVWDQLTDYPGGANRPPDFPGVQGGELHDLAYDSWSVPGMCIFMGLGEDAEIQDLLNVATALTEILWADGMEPDDQRAPLHNSAYAPGDSVVPIGHVVSTPAHFAVHRNEWNQVRNALLTSAATGDPLTLEGDAADLLKYLPENPTAISFSDEHITVTSDSTFNNSALEGRRRAELDDGITTHVVGTDGRTVQRFLYPRDVDIEIPSIDLDPIPVDPMDGGDEIGE